MRLIDLNILLYAVNADAPRHVAARKWVEEVMTEDSVGLPWVVILGFLRLATSRQVFTHPMDAQDAIDIVNGWLQRPNVVPLVPGRDHWVILRSLLSTSGVAGNLTTDAHLAALASSTGASSARPIRISRASRGSTGRIHSREPRWPTTGQDRQLRAPSAEPF